MNPHYPLVAERAAHRCEYCHAPEATFNFAFEVEHVVPPMQGGLDDQTNWALACRACNVHKADHLDGRDPESLATVSLFHPRQSRWVDHFRVNLANGSIEGLTPTGRGTVERLKINTPTQLAARRHWIRLGLFP